MMRKAARALTGLLLFATLAAPAAAIVDGQPDNGAHPNVGVMIVEIDGALYTVCSGTLIAPKVFLTAGHCTDDGTGDAVAVSARIWFRQDAGTRYDGTRDPLTGYPDKCIDDKTVALDACVTAHEMYNYGFDDFAMTPFGGFQLEPQLFCAAQRERVIESTPCPSKNV